MILGTSNYLNSQTGVHVAGSARTPAEAFGKLADRNPNLVLFELSIVGPFGFKELSHLRRIYPSIPVLVYSYHEEVVFAKRALEAGASGYLMKEAPPWMLAEAVREVTAGRIYISERVKIRMEMEKRVAAEGGVSRRMNGTLVNSLTNRELQILQFLGDGLSKERIQRELNLSPKRLNDIFYRMRKKLSLATTSELEQYAFHWAYYEGDFS